MPKLMEKLPKYCRFSGRDVGYFWLNGQRVFLPGGFNSPESLEAYHREMATLSQERAEHRNSFPSVSNIVTRGSSGKQQQAAHRKLTQLSVKHLVDEFLVWGKTHYLKNGKPSRTTEDYERSSSATVRMFGHVPVETFTQREMIVVQNHLVKSGLARRTVNDYISRTKRIFNWGVESGLIEPEVAMRLKFVKSLQKGRTQAHEMPPRQAVPDHIVDATLPHLP